MKLTRLRIATQVLVSRRQGVDRAGIIRHMKRRMKKDWNRDVIKLIDDVIKTRKIPEESSTAVAAKARVVADLAKALTLKKKGARWVWTGRFADLGAAKKKQEEIARQLIRSGFRYARTRGDVGLWTEGYEYRRGRGVDLGAGILLNERRKPYALTVDVESVRDFYKPIT